MASLIGVLIMGLLHVCIASNYDAYINQLQKRNQMMHYELMNDPVRRERLSEMYAQYPDSEAPFSSTEEDGSIPEDLWNNLVTTINDVRSRGEEPFQNHLWGEHKVSGGAGEGRQWLADEEGPVEKQEIKTDTLPAYCAPPNPCPIGMNEEDLPGPCDRNIPDTKAFNKRWIWDKMLSGECSCDKEHMKPCPDTRDIQRRNLHDDTNPYLIGNKRDQLVGKKSPKMMEDTRRQNNPYLEGDQLQNIKKKAGPPLPNIM